MLKLCRLVEGKVSLVAGGFVIELPLLASLIPLANSGIVFLGDPIKLGLSVKIPPTHCVELGLHSIQSSSVHAILNNDV